MRISSFNFKVESNYLKPKLALNRISAIGNDILKTLGAMLLQSAIWLGKAIAASIFLTVAIASVTAIALTALALPFTSHPFHRSVAFTHEILTKIKIIFHYGCGEETLEKADDRPDSPQFMLITPKGPIREASTPILYAPGYLDDPQSLRVVCRRLANQTGRKIYIVKYRNFFNLIDDHAQDIVRVGERIFRDNGGKRKLAFIGHSMGGLSSGTAITGWPKPIRLKQWITISSPLKGTGLARIGYGKCAKQMHPNSDFIKKFQNTYSNIAPELVFHFHAPSDHVVPVHSASTLGPNNHACHHYYGHLSSREDPMVINKIVELLTSRKNQFS